jgi:hypothetical protein
MAMTPGEAHNFSGALSGLLGKDHDRTPIRERLCRAVGVAIWKRDESFHRRQMKGARCTAFRDEEKELQGEDSDDESPDVSPTGNPAGLGASRQCSAHKLEGKWKVLVFSLKSTGV